MSDFEEVILLERIDLIARLSTSCEVQVKDYEVALVWISELVLEAKKICNQRCANGF